MSDPMEHLLAYVERTTFGRDRSRIELALAEALLNFLDVEWVRLHKVRQTLTDTEVWLAVEVNRQVNERFIDEAWEPAHATSIDKLPLIKRFLQVGLPDPSDERILLPIQFDDGRWFGFLEVAGESLDVQQLLVAGQIVAIFKNVVALLDYSETDKLTGLLNRKTFDDYLQRFLESTGRRESGKARARRKLDDGTSHWLGMLDIDHFKRINDSFGHSIGDEVLLLMARIMKATFRTNDMLFRFGGEEFIVLITSSTAEDASAAFERLRATVESHRFPLVGNVTTSVGYSRIAPSDQPTTLFDRADQALYWCKENGRNRVACYETLLAEGHIAPKKDTGAIELY